MRTFVSMLLIWCLAAETQVGAVDFSYGVEAGYAAPSRRDSTFDSVASASGWSSGLLGRISGKNFSLTGSLRYTILRLTERIEFYSVDSGGGMTPVLNQYDYIFENKYFEFPLLAGAGFGWGSQRLMFSLGPSLAWSQGYTFEDVTFGQRGASQPGSPVTLGWKTGLEWSWDFGKWILVLGPEYGQIDAIKNWYIFDGSFSSPASLDYFCIRLGLLRH